jgi:hypothetical protein
LPLLNLKLQAGGEKFHTSGHSISLLNELHSLHLLAMTEIMPKVVKQEMSLCKLTLFLHNLHELEGLT